MIFHSQVVQYDNKVKELFNLQSEPYSCLYSKALNLNSKIAITVFDKKTRQIVEHQELTPPNSKKIIDLLYAMSPSASSKIFRQTKAVKDSNQPLIGYKTGEIDVFSGKVLN